MKVEKWMKVGEPIENCPVNESWEFNESWTVNENWALNEI